MIKTLAKSLDSRQYEHHVMLESVVRQVVRRFRRKGCFFVEPQDLHQEGYRIALAALMNPKRDHERPAENYVYMAVCRELGNYVSKQLAVPSIMGHWHEARDMQYRDDLEEQVLVSPWLNPEERVIDKEMLSHQMRIRILLRRLLMHLLSESDQEIVNRLYGFDGVTPAGKPALAARQLGLPVKQVYKATVNLRRAVGSLEVYRLVRDVQKRMGEL